MQDVFALRHLGLPAVIVVVQVFVILVVVSFMVYRTSDMDMLTALFASSPGGMTDMALIASEIGGDSPKIVTMQLFRFILVIILWPQLISLF